MPPASDEPEDPRAALQREAQQMAQRLMRTSDLPPKLGWEDFDFRVDPFDPLLDDLEQVVASGRKDNETVQAIIQIGLERHLTLPVRHALFVELQSRLRSEVRLDVRQDAGTVTRALQQLSLPAQSIGLVWALYPRHLMTRLRDRHIAYKDEDLSLSAEEHALEEKADPAAIAAMGARARILVDRVIRGWQDKPPASPDAGRAIVALSPQWKDVRMARTLTSVFWHLRAGPVYEAAREALQSMPEHARPILELDLTIHDPPPEVRRALYPALVDCGSPRAMPRMVEDLVGAGPWTNHAKGIEHARAILPELVRTGDRRAIPMMLLVMSIRPPDKETRAAIVGAFGATPMKEEFERGLKALDAGQPVVVPGGTTQEEFLSRYGAFTDRMRPEKFQGEVQRVLRLWEQCYHEEIGWKIPRDLARETGPREMELRQTLEKEVRAKLGRLAGRGPASALESEFRTNWLVTAHNDVSGRVPLAIILDERSARAGPEVMREEREQQAAELYGLALRALEGGMAEDAERYLRAILQISPGHAFAQDALGRVRAGEALPGVGEQAAAPEPPRIIIP